MDITHTPPYYPNLPAAMATSTNSTPRIQFVQKEPCAKLRCKRMSVPKTCSHGSCVSPSTTQTSATQTSEPASTSQQGPLADLPPVAPRSMKARIDSEWRDVWVAASSERDRRQMGEDERHANYLKIQQSFRLAYWGQDNEAARRIMVSTIPSWPTVCLASRSDVLAQLGLSPHDNVERYTISGGRYWETQSLSTPFQVVTDQLVLLRRIGVKICDGFDKAFNQAGGTRGHSILPSPSPTLAITVVAPTQAAKRKRAISVTTLERTPCPRLSSSHLSPRSSATSSTDSVNSSGNAPPTVYTLPAVYAPPAVYIEPHRVLSLSPSPSYATLSPYDPQHVFSLSPSPPYATLSPSPSPSCADPLDAMWAHGSVYVPPDAEWPEGLYARDLVKGFEMMAVYKPSKPKPRANISLFTKVFPSVIFARSTFYRNWAAWRDSSESEKLRLQDQARTPEGLWGVCRSSLSSWPPHSD
ncbi:hypothetical protein C8Q80DRAFT_376843 [Daedaleopsis nitida]|nr:hypothetical protein C8Q80DRAFT_376843 [Daedaleopsis nitida]